jgi:predicted phage gp36 major capsid-like protein
VDAVVDAVPAIAARGRRLRRMSTRIAAEVKDRAGYIRYEDLRLEQQIEREELFFDAGHARGEIVGRQESHETAAAATPNGRALARAIASAALACELPRDQVVAVVLESARALVLGQPIPTGGASGHGNA